MLPLYHDPWFTFRFADDRLIPRFQLEGVPSGSHISVIKIDPETGERLGFLATATVGDGGWVHLPQLITMKAGEGFIAVPITHQLTLTILPGTYAVCRLDASAAVPAWATTGSFFSITRSADELSIVCQQSLVPETPASGALFLLGITPDQSGVPWRSAVATTSVDADVESCR